MTGLGPSRKDASIPSGVNTSKPCLIGLLLLAVACQADSTPRPDQALVESVPKPTQPNDRERDKAKLTRIDVHSLSELAGAAPELVAEVLEIEADDAQKIVDAAKALYEEEVIAATGGLEE